MTLCPRCNRPLVRVQRPEGIAFQCPGCQGCAVGVAVLRKIIPHELVKDLWLVARQQQPPRGGRCAICQRGMAEIPVRVDQQTLTLDVCTRCQFVWFDAQELKQLPKVQREPTLNELLPEHLREQLALAELKRHRQRELSVGFSDNAPDEAWMWIPGLLGLPIELDVDPPRSRPWVTWGLVGLMVLTFLMTIGNLRAAVNQFGLVPARFARLGGLTFLTSFFLHAGFFHLLGNAYFLAVFGDQVEDELGRWRYVWLVAAAALVGDVMHILGDPRALTPCVGASGGISGVIAFYALQYPQARLGFMWRIGYYFRWCTMPAWVALLVWLAWQALMAHAQLQGMSAVSALAHLGGFAVGLTVWLLWRTRWARAELAADKTRPRGAGDDVQQETSGV